jgi:ectoine hydroxylase-related dioxygenase (phytanoyl-CoA dioxygenase family)
VTSVISGQLLDQYEREGIIFPIKVFSAEEAGRFRSEIESVIKDCGKGPLRRLDSLHLFFDWAFRLVTHEALLDTIEGLLGTELLIDGTLVFYKPPHDSSYVSWHQDSVYSGWHLTPSTSAWIALTPSYQANGCMRVIPGSHKQGLLNHVNVRDDSNLVRRGERVEMVDESQAVDVLLQPGEISMHHSTIVHGSNPNTSDEPRIGFIVRFVTNKIANRERPLLRVRGKADCSHLSLAEPPIATDRQKAFSAWRAFTGS